MTRILEKFIALILLVLLSPIMLLVALLVFFDFGYPVIFKQRRSGLQGKEFVLYKFKTMKDAPDNEPNMSDHLRLTTLGRFLRSTSLDELPQLINIINGNMSFVGPRPLPVCYFSRYSSRQRKRLVVKPGITGWAQIKGRNQLSWPDKLELDVWYVEHRTSLLDLKILFLTIWKVFFCKNVNQSGQVTMEEFLGNGATANKKNAQDK